MQINYTQQEPLQLHEAQTQKLTKPPTRCWWWRGDRNRIIKKCVWLFIMNIRWGEEPKASYPVPFLIKLAVSLTEEGKPSTPEKLGGIFPSCSISGTHLPSTKGRNKQKLTEVKLTRTNHTKFTSLYYSSKVLSDQNDDEYNKAGSSTHLRLWVRGNMDTALCPLHL